MQLAGRFIIGSMGLRMWLDSMPGAGQIHFGALRRIFGTSDPMILCKG
jgi:hypothetical protein